jgi:hypothetical protein
LRVTIGRTFEWYELMGEFEGVYERLLEEGVCKHCGKARYCEWPAPGAFSQAPLPGPLAGSGQKR